MQTTLNCRRITTAMCAQKQQFKQKQKVYNNNNSIHANMNMQPVYTFLFQDTIVYRIFINQNLFLGKRFHSRHKVVNTLRKRHFTSISTATNCTAKRLNLADKQMRAYTHIHIRCDKMFGRLARRHST